MFSYTKGRNCDTQGSWTAAKSRQLWSGAQHTPFCRKISFVANYAHMGGGGSQKVTSDDEGEGGVTIPPKNDAIIYE